jgi:hypothetical protein
MNVIRAGDKPKAWHMLYGVQPDMEGKPESSVPVIGSNQCHCPQHKEYNTKQVLLKTVVTEAKL